MKGKISLRIKNKRQVLIFAMTISLALIAAAYNYFKIEEQKISGDKKNQLKAIAELKIEQITQWHTDRVADAEQIAQSYFFTSGVKDWVYNNKNTKNALMLLDRMKYLHSHNGYFDVFLVSNINRNLLPIHPETTRLDDQTLKGIQKSVELGDTYTDLYYNNSYKNIFYDIISPVRDENKIIAFVVLRVNPFDYLFPLIKKWPLPSETSETLLAADAGDDVLLLNELRFIENSALNTRIFKSKKEIVAVKAVSGVTGLVEGVDYRQVDVIAYLSEIPGTNWFMVAKVDKNEIYSELYFRASVITIVTLSLILITALGLFYLYRNNQKNLYKELFIKEKELREYNEEFDTILYSIGDGVITTDTLGNIKQMNQAAVNLTGWLEKDARGMPIENVFNIVNAHTRLKVENPVGKVIRNGKAVGLANHTVLISKTGEEHHISDSAAPIIDKEGSINGVVFVFSDVSDKYLAQQELAEKENLLRETGRIAKVGGWNFDVNTSEGKWTDEVAIIHDLDPTQKTNVQLGLSFYLPESRKKIDEAIRAAIVFGTPYELELEMVSAAGNHKWVKTIGHPVYENGKIVKLSGSFQDITERKKDEIEKFRLLNIIESSLNEIYIFDANTFKFEYINYGALKNIGYSLDEMKQLTPIEIKPLVSIEKFKEIIQPLITGEKDLIIFETVHRRKDGSDYDVEVHLQLIKHLNKSSFLAVINDITERKKTEAALEKHRNHLEELVEERTEEIDAINRELLKEIERKEIAERALQESLKKEKELSVLKTRFISTASHEFRTPLTAVLSSAELIERYGKNWDENKLANHLNRIKNSVDYLNRLIEDVLTINRADAGKISLDPKRIDLHELCVNIKEEFQLSDGGKHEFVFNYQPLQKIYRLDPKQIYFILQNLISNAYKYSPAGGKIVLSIIESESGLNFKVSDEGIGIPEGEIKLLFQPFHRSSNTESIQGTGLGLSIVKNAVDLYGGIISVQSELGKGTTFDVSIPIKSDLNN